METLIRDPAAMSRGPGRVERLIRETFTANPTRAFTAEELASLAYPGVNRIEKKHRVAVLRAAWKACSALRWRGLYADKFGRLVIFFNEQDVHSYALARTVRIGRDDSTKIDWAYIETQIIPGDVQSLGRWHCHVALWQAEHEGDEDAIQRAQDDMQIAGYRAANGYK